MVDRATTLNTDTQKRTRASEAVRPIVSALRLAEAQEDRMPKKGGHTV